MRKHFQTKGPKQFTSCLSLVCQYIVIKKNQFVFSLLIICAFLTHSMVQFGHLFLLSCAINWFTIFYKVKPENITLIAENKEHCLLAEAIWPCVQFSLLAGIHI